MKKLHPILLVSCTSILLILAGCGASQPPPDEATISGYQEFLSDVTLSNPSNPVAVLDTAKGMLAIELYQREATLTVKNFIDLVDKDFYNGLTFHLVQSDFVIQTGDPTGIGTGDSGTPAIQLEVHPDLRHDAVGVVGMARREEDQDSATSQFYITLAAQPSLDRRYAIFGRVVKGIEVVQQIQRGDRINNVEIINQ